MTVASPPGAAVLICGSDSRLDVLERVLPSFPKFWPDCPYPVFLGLNSGRMAVAGMKTLVAPPSEWRRECLHHIAQIPQSHLILLLDDFLIRESVEQERVEAYLATVIGSDLRYLRLSPLGKSLFEAIKDRLAKRIETRIQLIKEGRAYYSGLQIAIWERRHFASLLEKQGSIWDFEHHSSPAVGHYVITERAPICYSHLIDKGRWLPSARSLLRQAGLPTHLGSRPVWSNWINARLLLDQVRLKLFGYPVN